MRRLGAFSTLLTVLVVCFLATIGNVEAIQRLFFDFGGQYIKCFAHFNHEQQEIVVNGESQRMTLSSVCVRGNLPFFASAYQGCSSQSPQLAIPFVTRLLGKPFDDPYVKQYMQNFPTVPLIPHPKRATVAVQTKDLGVISIEEAFAMILEYFRRSAFNREKELNPSIHGEQRIGLCMATVPSFYSLAERQALVDAGKLVGFTIAGFVVDLEAVSLSCIRHLGESKTGKVLLYDVGATKVSATLIDISKDSKGSLLTVLSSTSNPLVGGLDVSLRLRDELIIPKILALNSSKETEEYLKRDATMSLLLTLADKIKVELGGSNSVTKVFDIVTSVVSFTITKQEFADKCLSLFVQMQSPIEQIIQNPSFPTTSIDLVVPVGASSRLEHIDNWLNTIFKDKIKYVNHEEVIVQESPLATGLVDPRVVLRLKFFLKTNFPNDFYLQLANGTKLLPVQLNDPKELSFAFSVDGFLHEKVNFFVGQNLVHTLQIENLSSLLKNEPSLLDKRTTIHLTITPSWSFRFSCFVEYKEQEVQEVKAKEEVKEETKEEAKAKEEVKEEAKEEAQVTEDTENPVATEKNVETTETVAKEETNQTTDENKSPTDSSNVPPVSKEPKFVSRKKFYSIFILSTYRNALNFSEAEYKEAETRMNKFYEKEREINLFFETKNEFETKVINYSNLLFDEQFEIVLTEKEREKLKTTLEKDEQILYLPEKKQTTKLFADKLAALNDLFSPFVYRSHHLKTRQEVLPKVDEQLSAFLKEYEALEKTPELERNSLTQQDIESLNKSCIEFQEWYEKIKETQAALPPSTNPIFTFEELQDKLTQLGHSFNDAHSKKSTPLPPPTPPPTVPPSEPSPEVAAVIEEEEAILSEEEESKVDL